MCVLTCFFPSIFFYIKFIYRFIFNQLYMANCRQNAQQRFALNILQQKQHVTCNKIKMNTYTCIHTHPHTVHCTANKMEASKNLRITNVMCHLGHSSELTLKIYDTLIQLCSTNLSSDFRRDEGNLYMLELNTIDNRQNGTLIHQAVASVSVIYSFFSIIQTQSIKSDCKLQFLCNFGGV